MGPFEFTIPGGPGVAVSVTEQNGDLVFTLTTLGQGGLLADLRGFFFHVNNETLLPGLSATGPAVTETQFAANAVNDLGNGANMNGGGPRFFDVGIEIGSQGIGQGDDIGSTSFTLSHATLDLSLDLLTDVTFGARLTSVGPAGDREDSLKLTTTSPPVVCFYPGTRIATPAGEVPVETLAAGDLVLTAEGVARPIRWVGRQTVATVFADPRRVLPVRIPAGALGAGLPRRDLLVSPDHALFLDGALVQAGALVGLGAIRIERDVPAVFTYRHVELADHALVLAEGVAAESFIDQAQRLAFDNWADREALDDDAALAELAMPRAKAARQVPPALRARLAGRVAA